MSNPNYTIIDFMPNGDVEAMHREDMIDLSFLGEQRITRASELLYSQGAWGIALPCQKTGGDWVIGHDIQAGFKTYNECREIEVEWLERSRFMDVEPASFVGYELLNDIRIKRGYPIIENPMLGDYQFKRDKMLGQGRFSPRLGVGRLIASDPAK